MLCYDSVSPSPYEQVFRLQTFGIVSDGDQDAPDPPAQGTEADVKDRRKIRFEDSHRDQTEVDANSVVDSEQARPSLQNTIAGKSNREFRLRFGLKRAKPQVEDTQITTGREEEQTEAQPDPPVDKVSSSHQKHPYHYISYSTEHRFFELEVSRSDIIANEYVSFSLAVAHGMRHFCTV